MSVAERMGRVGLPEPVGDLARRRWDAIVVGAGHNGLTAAAYLARAGRSVLALERRDVLGGACTLERPFADERYLVSPCAYVVGLLDRLVIDELGLAERGYRVFPADPNLWVPLPDGTSYASFLDPDRTAAHMRENGFSEADIRGRFAYEEAFERCRVLLREGPGGDTWLGSSPGRERIEEILGHDPELISIVFEASIAETLGRYVEDERLHHALFGQGIIGAWAGPRDPGTASVKLMHHQGQLGEHGSVWGYVEGGMGRVSFAIAQAAIDAGAVIAAGCPVAEILPGEGVVLEDGTRVASGVVVSCAEPKRTFSMVPGESVPDDLARRVGGWKTRSAVVKLNAALTRIPEFTAAGSLRPEKAMVLVTAGLDAAQEGFERAARGEPGVSYAELYFQTGYDPSVAPEGRHLMSAFAQYAPYDLAEGDWDSRREEIGNRILEVIAAYAPGVHECIEHSEVLGPPDIEERMGLTGGQIFQGEAMPDQMWENRFDHRTGIPGLYLCGAATHPAGSVIALNGRSAAMAVLEDVGRG
ncbi:MAG: NAD(P)/FAD-dependent oxidoreductase [Solirubrobacterales bacterium]